MKLPGRSRKVIEQISHSFAHKKTQLPSGQLNILPAGVSLIARSLQTFEFREFEFHSIIHRVNNFGIERASRRTAQRLIRDCRKWREKANRRRETKEENTCIFCCGRGDRTIRNAPLNPGRLRWNRNRDATLSREPHGSIYVQTWLISTLREVSLGGIASITLLRAIRFPRTGYVRACELILRSENENWKSQRVASRIVVAIFEANLVWNFHLKVDTSRPITNASVRSLRNVLAFRLTLNR